MVLGVDNSQAIVGVKEDPEKVQERLTSFLQSGCSLPVSASVGRHQDPNGWVHWLEIPRQRNFEPLRYDGRVCVRRNRGSVQPSPAELQELYNVFGYILTEERTIQAAELADIESRAFHAYLDQHGLDVVTEPQPDVEDDLRNRGVLSEVGGELRPTLYGVLAFGKDPQGYQQTQNFSYSAWRTEETTGPPTSCRCQIQGDGWTSRWYGHLAGSQGWEGLSNTADWSAKTGFAANSGAKGIAGKRRGA